MPPLRRDAERQDALDRLIGGVLRSGINLGLGAGFQWFQHNDLAFNERIADRKAK